MFAAFFPRTFPEPLLFSVLVVLACVTSVWKVNLPIPLASGSTLSASYAANLMALLLLGPSHAMAIAVVGAWMQCTYKVKLPYPLYRTIFGTAAQALTMIATGVVYLWLGGQIRPVASFDLAGPLVGAIATYFLVNTGLVAGAIALSTGRRVTKVWRDDFLWSATSFMVAGTAGAIAAIIVARGEHWTAMLMLAPVHLTYRTYGLFIGRLDDQCRHAAEAQRLHQQTVSALDQTRRAERELAEEKRRLALALVGMARLEQQHVELLGREKAARASAEQASQLKDQFLAIVSHELRTPLNAVLGWADMLRRGRIGEAQRTAALDTIYRSAKRQAQLIDDLLDVARIMSGKLRLDRTVVDLRGVVRDALLAVQPLALAKKLEITVDADPALSLIYADASRLQQVVANLLSNAVKFTPSGGALHLRLRQLGADVELEVADTGEGIRSGLSTIGLRSVSSGRRFDHPDSGWPRTGPLDREAPRGSPQGFRSCAERRARPWRDVHGSAAGRHWHSGRRCTRAGSYDAERNHVRQSLTGGHLGAGRRRRPRESRGCCGSLTGTRSCRADSGLRRTGIRRAPR